MLMQHVTSPPLFLRRRLQYFPPSSFAYTAGNVSRLSNAPWVPPNSGADVLKPSFQAYHPDFLTLIGSNPT